MIQIGIDEVLTMVQDLVDSTKGDMKMMKDNEKIQEFYKGMLFGYSEIVDFLIHRKEVEELR